MKTKRLFPEYDLIQTTENGKVVITLMTKVRSLEVNTQKWYQSYVTEETSCDPDKVAGALRDAMERFLLNCYVAMTIGIPNLSIVNANNEPIFIPDESQISEKERMKKFMMKKLGL